MPILNEEITINQVTHSFTTINTFMNVLHTVTSLLVQTFCPADNNPFNQLRINITAFILLKQWNYYIKGILDLGSDSTLIWIM